MATGISIELLLVLLAGFLLLCILSSKASSKLGIPALVLFIGIGMLAGSDGPGGIDFTNVHLTKDIGSVALALILFAGGLEASWSSLRPVVYRAVSLATLGVLISTVLIAAFAHFALGMTFLSGLLLGSVVSSTDAAAVFAVLRNSGIRLKHRIAPLLELESGTNDPLAIFLTLTMISIIKHPEASPLIHVPRLLIEMPLGLAFGLVASHGASILINRLRLEYDGLYPVITLAIAFLAYGGASLVGGNGFLAVYVAGLGLGSRNFIHKLALIQFHNGIAWLMQITMFVLLGLLAFPSDIAEVAGPGMLLAAFMIIVARPIAVFISLAFAHLGRRSKLFVAWAGLRGAVPIILATFPLMADVPSAGRIFNLVFFVVISSVLVQGTTVRRVAKALSIIAKPRTRGLPLSTHDHPLFEVEIGPASPALGKLVVELNLPPTALLLLINRDGEQLIPRGSTLLQEGDSVTIATRRDDRDALLLRF